MNQNCTISVLNRTVAHAGEALEPRRAFERLAASEQTAVIAFLESLQVLPPER